MLKWLVMEQKLNKKIFSTIAIIVFLAAIGLIFFVGKAKKQNRTEESQAAFAEERPEDHPKNAISKIAWITDIHADKKNKREEGDNIIYPNKYKECLEQVLGLGTDLVIATGDNTNNGGAEYYNDMKAIVGGRKFLWVKGNHDSDDFKILSDKNYYSSDYDNLRVIVLDTAEQFGSSTGYLDDAQLNFLRDSLGTDKQVVIAMHHPPFFYNSREDIYTRDKEPLFENFFNALTPNVKYVLTGHWHYDIGAEIGGVQFLTANALTQDGECNYKIIGLQ
ncbi:MAG: metallophosphoesterase [Candidatus Moranbacteria bacterium]|nr:metallophosphoesterase [Candidatus Moranbacteria bacterium]